MNKKVMILSAIVAALVLLTACGSNNSWENEEVTVVSDRLMADTVKAEWTIENGEAGKDALIRIAVENKDGEPIEAFDLNHEKLLHLMVISKDLSYFNERIPRRRRLPAHSRFEAGWGRRHDKDGMGLDRRR